MIGEKRSALRSLDTTQMMRLRRNVNSLGVRRRGRDSKPNEWGIRAAKNSVISLTNAKRSPNKCRWVRSLFAHSKTLFEPSFCGHKGRSRCYYPLLSAGRFSPAGFALLDLQTYAFPWRGIREPFETRGGSISIRNSSALAPEK